MSPEEITLLRAQLRTQVAASRAQRHLIRLSRGLERHEAHLEKRRIGATTRVLHAALALLRGRPYRALEPRTHTPLDQYAVASWLAGGGTPPPDVRARVKAWCSAPTAAAVPCAGVAA